MEEEEPEEQTIFEVVETMPEFPQVEMAGLMQYRNRILNILPLHRKTGTQGRVTAQFVVNKDGGIVDAKVLERC